MDYRSVLRKYQHAPEGQTRVDTPEQPPYSFDFDNRFDDSRWQAAERAWRTIAQHPDLADALRWTRIHQPDLHRKSDELWDRVDKAWDSGSLEHLQSALNLWVNLHLGALALYRESLPRG